jgi:hypothetical protein
VQLGHIDNIEAAERNSLQQDALRVFGESGFEEQRGDTFGGVTTVAFD